MALSTWGFNPREGTRAGNTAAFCPTNEKMRVDKTVYPLFHAIPPRPEPRGERR